MEDELIQEPFDKNVQELQKQEKDIEKKIGLIKKRIEDGYAYDDAKDALNRGKKELDGVRKEVTKRKIEDMEKEIDNLKKFARNPINLPPPSPPLPPPGAGGAGGTGGGGAVSSEDLELPSDTRHEVVLEPRTFIVARSSATVWVWDPRMLAWSSPLQTGDPIVLLEKVDETLAVRTKDTLWLFNPIERTWIGRLNAQIEEVKDFTILVPLIRPKKVG